MASLRRWALVAVGASLLAFVGCVMKEREVDRGGRPVLIEGREGPRRDVIIEHRGEEPRRGEVEMRGDRGRGELDKRDQDKRDQDKRDQDKRDKEKADKDKADKGKRGDQDQRGPM